MRNFSKIQKIGIWLIATGILILAAERIIDLLEISESAETTVRSVGGALLGFWLGAWLGIGKKTKKE